VDQAAKHHQFIGKRCGRIAFDPTTNDACIAWAKNSYNAMQSFMGPGRYVNYLGDDEGSEEVVAAYGLNYRRLQQLKAKYDPDNFFRLNQNIQPKG
jgi:FAD/FMN-containing dehydrogenase